MLSFENCNILVVGDVMLDTMIEGSANRVSPEAPVPVLLFEKQTQVLGGAGNVTANLSSLGAKCSLMGVIGDDIAGKTIIDILIMNGISDKTIITDKSKTINKVRYLARQQHLLRVDYEDKLLFDEKQLYEKFCDNLCDFDIVIFSDYGKGTLNSISKLINQCKTLDIPCVIDPKGSDFRKYSYANYLTPNLFEFETIVGKCSGLEAIQEKSRSLVKDLSLGGLLVTLGDNGLAITTSSLDFFHFTATGRNVFDVTGAGDTVIATFACMLSSNETDYVAAKVANAAAGLVVTKPGTATTNINELNFALAINRRAKIQTKNSLEKILNSERKNDKKIVFTNGCFDLLHVGHIDYLEKCKKRGDILIVGLNTDKSITKLKGPMRPINEFEERAKILSSLECVDYVIGFSEETPFNLIKAIQPNVLVKGADYALDDVIGADFVSSYGGMVELTELTEGYSTTNVIEKILGKFGELK